MKTLEQIKNELRHLDDLPASARRAYAQAFMSVLSPMERQILMEKYIMKQRYEHIARTIHYSVSYTKGLAHEALDKLSKRL